MKLSKLYRLNCYIPVNVILTVKPVNKTAKRYYIQQPLVTQAKFSSVAQSCPTLCNPMNCSTPGLPVHHQLLEFTQTHVHRVSDAIQPSHPLSSPSPPAPNPSQHQSLFKLVSSLHQVAKYRSFNLSISPPNEYSGLISFRKTDWISLQYNRLSRVFSSNTMCKHQFFSAHPSLWPYNKH